MEIDLFRIERFSVKNGPGIRTTVFFKGCPLRCAWCANPESQSSGRDLLFNEELCIAGCAECAASCPASAITIRGEKAGIDRSLCSPCDACSSVCPSKALSSAGFGMPLEGLIEELEKDRAFHDSSGGGVTLSGGEPLFRPEGTLALLEALGRKGMSRVLDTSGEAEPAVFAAALDLCEIVLFDLKIADGKKHERFTGADNARILENLRRAARSSPEKLVVRIPLVPGINDGAEDAVLFGKALSGLRYEAVHILPYHRLGVAKYAMLGRDYSLAGTKAPAKEDVLRFAALLRESGVPASVRV